ncbi:MAG: hypothetical protein HY557_07710 [Euryarchaeota archaeon]|nr:hypothetical protein [Euryarchaeota archaeon]
MESRKIQKVGAATFTISLPKEWVSRRNLKKGDQLFLLEDGESLRLLLSPSTEGRTRESMEFLIDADLCEEPGMLERVIVGNYVLGRERIVIRASARLRSDHQDEMRNAIRRLMGIGIIEETASRVVLQCSINPAHYPLDALIKRLYNLGYTMLTESLEALVTGDAALAADALKREDDADMMYWLILRLVLSAQLDEALLEPLGMRSRLEIPGYRIICQDLEAVADHGSDIAKHVQELLALGVDLPTPLLKSIRALAETIGQLYGKALGALLSRDLKQANEAIRLSRTLEKKEQDIGRIVLKEIDDPKVVIPVRGLVNNLIHIGEYARSIAVIAYNRYLEKPTNLCRPVGAA